MAYYERDYYQERSPTFGGRLKVWSFTTWIIVINVAVYVIDSMLGRAFEKMGPLGLLPLEYYGHFSAQTAIYSGQVWRFITFQFLHAGIGHLFFNMLALFFFGPMIESYLGSKRYLAFYLICGVGGAAMYLVLWQLGAFVSSAVIPLVGASAGIFGILIAGARVAPDTRVMLIFPPIPITLRTLAWVFVGIAVLTILREGPNAGGEAGHLGGALVGFVLITRPQWLNVFDRFSLGQAFSRWRQKSHEASARRRAQREKDLEEQVDRILDKVAKQGLGSLSDKERRTLKEATERQRGR